MGHVKPKKPFIGSVRKIEVGVNSIRTQILDKDNRKRIIPIKRK